jgi:hypothetical protein
LLRLWFKQQSYESPTVVIDNSDSRTLYAGGGALLELCLLIDEIISNCLLHRDPRPSRMSIILRPTPSPLLQINESFGDAESDFEMSLGDEAEQFCDRLICSVQEWAPYRQMLTPKGDDSFRRRGRGAEYIDDWCSQLEMGVLVGNATSGADVYLVGNDAVANSVIERAHALA